MLNQEKKKAIIVKYQQTTLDTGSSNVQIALLSARIKEMQEHLSKNKHDKASTRGLQRMVAQRKKHMKYLKKKNLQGYEALIQELGIRG